jgi:hypothetical protein
MREAVAGGIHGKLPVYDIEYIAAFLQQQTFHDV